MIGPADPRSVRRFAATLLVAGCALRAGPAAAQFVPPVVGRGGRPSVGALPSIPWPPAEEDREGRWSSSYARMSTGFEVVSSRRFGGYAGPTLGLEGGRVWQDGRLVYGIAGGLDYLAAVGDGTPGFGGLAYTRDFAGTLQMSVGTLLTPDVLLYARAGASAVHETLRAGPTPVSQPFAREDIAVRPNAQVGVAWALTDRLTLAVEAGVVGGGLR